jgi:hypothetical protein
MRLPAKMILRAGSGSALYDGQGGMALLGRIEGLAPQTPVATAEGDMPAEALAPGDLILTPGGAAVPVLRCLLRQVDATAAARQPGLRAVLVAAGALGEGLPRRALAVGPDQPLGCGPWRAAARMLVNGSTIRTAPARAATFVRVVLGVDGALDVAGLACPTRPRPFDPRQAVALRMLADRLAGSVADRLAGSAGTAPGQLAGKIEEAGAGSVIGWALDGSRPDAPVPLEVAANGVPVAWGFASLRRPDLEMRGLGGGACAFAIRFAPLALPAWLTVRRATDGADVPGSPILLGAAPPAEAALAAIARRRAEARSDPARNELAGALFTAIDRLSGEGTVR